MFEFGQQIFIERKFDKSHLKYKSRFIGLKEGSFIIIENPLANNTYVPWYTGTQSVIKFMRGGHIYAFESTVIDNPTKPVPLLYLSPPKNFVDMNLRKYERITTFLSCFIKRDGEPDGENWSDTVIDLSPSGALIETEKRKNEFETDEDIIISFVLPNGLKVENLPVIVRNIKKSDDKNKMHIGVKFRDDPNDALNDVILFFTDN